MASSDYEYDEDYYYDDDELFYVEEGPQNEVVRVVYNQQVSTLIGSPNTTFFALTAHDRRTTWPSIPCTLRY